MALEVQYPLFFEREKSNFKKEKGNYSIDYKAKGDTVPSSAVTVLDVPMVQGLPSTLDFNVIPFHIDNSVPHVTGFDQNFRSFTTDIHLYANYSNEPMMFFIVPEENFKVKYQGASLENISDEDPKKYIVLNFEVETYNGRNPSKSFQNLFNGGVKLYPEIFPSNPKYQPDCLFGSSNYNLSDYTYAIGNKLEILSSMSEPFSEITYLQLYVNLPSPPALSTVDAVFENVGILYVEELEPTVEVDILIVSPTKKTGTQWGQSTGQSIDTTPYTNFRDKALSDPKKYYGRYKGISMLLNKDEGLYFSVNFRSLLPINESFPSEDDVTFPRYSIRIPLEVDRSDMYLYLNAISLENTDTLGTSKITITGGISNELDIIDDFKSDIVLTKKTIGEGIAFQTMTSPAGVSTLTAVNLTDREITVSAEPNSLPTVSTGPSGVYTTTFGQTTPYLFLNSYMSIRYNSITKKPFLFFLLDSVTVNNSFRLSSLITRKLASSSNMVIGINDAVDVEVPNEPGHNVISTLRSNLKSIRGVLRENGRDVFITPQGDLLIINGDSFPGITSLNKASVTVDTKYKNALEYTDTDKYYVVLQGDGDMNYDATSGLNGAPVSLKVFNLNALNLHYLTVRITSNPDYAEQIKIQIQDSTSLTPATLANRLTSVLRQYNILVNYYDSDSIVFLNVGTENQVIDISLYATDKLEENPPQEAFQRLKSLDKNFTNQTTTGEIVPLKEVNTSISYWVDEQTNKQNVLLSVIDDKNNLNPLSSKRIYFSPVESEKVMKIKVETNMQTGTYSILNVSLPSFALFTSNLTEYYSQLKNNINAAVSVISSAKLTVSVDSGSFSSYVNSNVPTICLVFKSDAKHLRNIKIGMTEGSEVYEVKSSSETYRPGVEYLDSGIFTEFADSSIQTGISFWLT